MSSRVNTTTRYATLLLYATAVLVFAILQIALSADILVLTALVFGSLIAVPSLLAKRTTAAEIFLLGYAIYTGFGALVAKGLLWQPVDQNLVSANQTSTALIMSSLSVLIGYFASRALAVRLDDKLKLGLFFSQTGAIRSAAAPVLLIGCAMYVAHILLKPDLRSGNTEGFGGFGSFYFLVNVGLSLCYSLASRTGRNRYWLLIIASAAFLLFCSMLSNERRPVIDFCIVTALSFAFNKRLRGKWWLLIGGTVAGSLVLLIVSPAIQAVRLRTSSLSPFERVSLVWDTMAEANFNPALINAERDKTAQMYQYAYGQNLSYAFPSTSDIDRYSLVFPLDQIVRNEGVPSLGLSSLVSGMTNMLPGPFVSKTGISSGDEIAWTYGLRAYGSIGRPVLGAPASAFAVGRWWGAAILPGVLLFFVFLGLRVIGGSLAENPIAIALATILLVLVEYDVAGLLAYFVRPFWTLLLALLTIRFISKRLPSYRRWEVNRVASANNSKSGKSSPAQTSAWNASL
jgi:hypothetical protein